MNNKNNFNLILRPSRYFFTLISGLHLIIIFLVCISGLNWLKILVLLLTIIFSYSYLLYKFIYRKAKYSIISLQRNQDVSAPQQWLLKLSSFKITSAELQPKGYASDYFIIMHFKILRDNKYIKNFKLFKYKIIPVIIFPDMLDFCDYIALKRFLYG
jgi:hypothetical protein